LLNVYEVKCSVEPRARLRLNRPSLIGPNAGVHHQNLALSSRERLGVKNERGSGSRWLRNVNMLTVRTVAIVTDPAVVLARQSPDVASRRATNDCTRRRSLECRVLGHVNIRTAHH
jgi:hypothetical protein